jgi:lipoprotein NlpI
MERLAQNQPGDTVSQRELSLAFENVGEVQYAKRDLPAALNSFQTANAIMERLVRADPANTEWQRMLSVTDNYIGNVQRRQDDLAAALNSYQAYLGIAERLAKSDPDNATWQSDVTIADSNVGNVQAAMGDQAAALRSYQAGLAVMDRLAKANPGNLVWQRNLAILYDKIGEALFISGRLDEALATFSRALQIGKSPNDARIYFKRAAAELGTNDAAAAASDEAAALELKPAEPYYVLWLHVARALSGQGDTDELAANAIRIDQSKWPWPAIALFLGAISPADMQQAAAAATTETVRLDQVCEASFFAAIDQFKKRGPAALQWFRSAADQGPQNDPYEHAIVQFELKRLEDAAAAQAK